MSNVGEPCAARLEELYEREGLVDGLVHRMRDVAESVED